MSLRAKWQAHCQSSLRRPVLLIDEAQEVSPQCLTELRLLQSARFDSDSLLFTVLSGDGRLTESWLSILEASYIIKLLPPYYNNLGKRS